MEPCTQTTPQRAHRMLKCMQCLNQAPGQMACHTALCNGATALDPFSTNVTPLKCSASRPLNAGLIKNLKQEQQPIYCDHYGQLLEGAVQKVPWEQICRPGQMYALLLPFWDCRPS